MTKAQQVFDAVEAKIASGVKKADAFRQVADELGQPFNSIRGAYYTHTRSIGGTPGAKKKRPTNVDPVDQAVSVLQDALSAIDDEIADAKQRAEDAEAEYKELREGAAMRKAQISAKIEALTAES